MGRGVDEGKIPRPVSPSGRKFKITPMTYSSPSITRRDALRWFGCIGAAAALAPLTGRTAPVGSGSKEPAPSLAGGQPGFYRFKIGEFEALALNDGGAAFPLPATWPAVPEEKSAAELKAVGLPVDTARFPFNVLLVKIGSELILVDAGCGAMFGPMGGRLLANLAAAGVKPEQITAVILSHGHGDHHGGLLDAQSKAPVFKNAQHFITRREFDFWMGSSPDLSQQLISEADKKGTIQGAQFSLGGLKDRWNFIKPGDKLLGGLEIVDAPGHTPGHIALLVASGNDQLLHFVDAAHHHEITFAHPDWAFFGDTQPEVAVQTRKRLLDRAAADKLRLFGAHMPFPSLGRVRSERGRYEYRIEPWVV
jgi:glyoxylase-like metal-dependent hydrolase (beta-lactamase superfamily II)